MSRVRSWLATPEARWILAIFLLAFVVRLAFVVYVHPSPRDGRYDDSVFYDSAARHLAAGDGYVYDPVIFNVPGDPKPNATALWPPGYPATLAVLYKFSGNAQWAGRLFNVLVGALTPVLVFLIARRLFDLAAAAFAGVALAIFPGHVLFTAILLSETWFGFLLALILAICVYFVFPRERPNVPLLVGLGVLTAFTGYVRGEFLAYGVVLALLLLLRYRRQAAVPIAALTLGAVIVVVPWVVRNEVQMGEPIIGTTGAGRVAYQGHNPETNGGESFITYFKLEEPYRGTLDRTEIEVRANSDGMRLARTYAWDHKLRELQLVGKRMYLLFRNDEAGVQWIQVNKPLFLTASAEKLSRLSDFSFFGLIAVVLAGAPFWWRWRDLRMWVVFAVIPFYMLLFGVLFIGNPRYHYAMYIPFAVFAGPGLRELWRMTSEHWRAIAGGRTLAAAGEERPSAR